VKLSIAEVLGEAWSLYTRHAGKLILMAGVVFAVTSIVAALVGDNTRLIAVVLVVNTIGILWLQGALAVAVSDLRAGRPLGSVFSMLARVEPRIWPLLGAGILVGILAGGLILTALILGLYPLLVPGVIVLTFTVAVIPLVVLEGAGVVQSFRSSYRLVRGDGWRVFAVIALTALFSAIVAIVISTLFAQVPSVAGWYLASMISNAVVIPFVALAWILTYFDLKLNKEPHWTTS
jgi:hypothetical protein